MFLLAPLVVVFLAQGGIGGGDSVGIRVPALGSGAGVGRIRVFGAGSMVIVIVSVVLLLLLLFDSSLLKV